MKNRHAPATTPYFRVSGQKKEFEVDTTTGKFTGKSTVEPSRTRFESVSLGEAERFATDVYKREGIVCEIHEISR